VNDYFKRLARHTNEMLGQIPDLRGIILGGPGPTKYDFAEGDYLNYMLKQKVIATLDTTYVSERGVDEIVERSQDLLKGVRYMEEKKIVGNSCSVLVYVADGIMSGLPVAKRLQPYKSPRWLPVTFDLTEKVTEKDVRKSLLQTAREAM